MTRASRRWLEAAGITVEAAPAIRHPTDKLDKTDKSASSVHFDHFAQPPGVAASSAPVTLPILDRVSNSANLQNCDDAPDHLGTEVVARCPWVAAVARLRALAAAPGDVPPKLWPSILERLEALAKLWGPKLDGMGWTLADAFGAHPAAPWARLDQAGLWAFLSDRDLAALTSDSAALIADGKAQTYDLTSRRRLAEPGRVLLWEIAP